MKLFSKRNRISSEFLDRERYNSSRLPIRILKRRQELISEETRNRIISQIKFLCTTKDFLETYLLAEDKEKGKFCLNTLIFDDFALSELGYKFSTSFDFRKVEIIFKTISDDQEQSVINIYDDYKLFDLLEVIILFSKEDKRDEVVERLNKILIEESEQWVIVKYLISKNSGDDLDNIINQLKDFKLKEKLKSYTTFFENGDYLNSAKLSSDVLNIIFSDFLEDKKEAIEKILNNISDKVVEKDGGKHEEKKENFKEYLNDHIKSSKNYINNIFDVRHTEKDRIKISNPYVYKLISINNQSIIEFVLTSLRNEFIENDNWEDVKNEYISKYNIDKDGVYFYEKEENFDDIPF